ncbi:hypothetical protein BMR86_25710, partial [Stenotrophomonas sp. KAs 5-3]
MLFSELLHFFTPAQMSRTEKLFLYINKDNIKVIYSLKINQTTPGILVSCDSNNNFACQTTMTEDVIQRITTFFHTSPDVKNRE